MDKKKEIQSLYENYVSQNISLTENYKKYSNEFAKSVDGLIQRLSKVDENLIEEVNCICDLMSEMQEEQAKIAFESGYILGTNILMEVVCRR